MVLDPKLSVREEVSLLLFSRYPARVSRLDLRAWTRGGTDGAFRQALLQMKKDRHLHEGDGGFLLTKAGIGWVERQIRRH